jgi:hypothetical protein
MRKQTNTLSPSPKGFQSPKFSDSDFREVRGLGRPKSSVISAYLILAIDLKITFENHIWKSHLKITFENHIVFDFDFDQRIAN